MEKDAEFLLSKAIEFINRAVASGLCLSSKAQALFENVNRLRQLLLGTPPPSKVPPGGQLRTSASTWRGCCRGISESKSSLF
jgi:hypothetical protein